MTLNAYFFTPLKLTAVDIDQPTISKFSYFPEFLAFDLFACCHYKRFLHIMKIQNGTPKDKKFNILSNLSQ